MVQVGLCILLLTGSTPYLRAMYAAADTYAADDTTGVSSVRDIHHPIAALKNNLLYDAAATPNLQLEFRLAEHWSLQAGVGFNPFPLDDKVLPKWRHVSVELAPRYWLCQTFTRDFVSVNVAYTHFNVAGGMYPIGWMYRSVRDNRYQGDAVLFGASYGWQFAISPHFSIELEGGVDAGVAWYDRFKCKHCGEKLAHEKKWFALPKLGVNLVVLLDGNETEFEERCDCGKLHTAQQTDTVTEYEQPLDSIPMDTVPIDSTAIQPSEKPTEHVPPMDCPTPPASKLRKRIQALEELYKVYPTESLRSAIEGLKAQEETEQE